MPFIMHGFTFKLPDGQEINMPAQEFPEHGHEYRAVEEIISDELDTIYHDAIARSQGVCPQCYTEVSHWENGVGDGVTEITDVCPRCGWESDSYYE